MGCYQHSVWWWVLFQPPPTLSPPSCLTMSHEPPNRSRYFWPWANKSLLSTRRSNPVRLLLHSILWIIVSGWSMFIRDVHLKVLSHCYKCELPPAGDTDLVYRVLLRLQPSTTEDSDDEFGLGNIARGDEDASLQKLFYLLRSRVCFQWQRISLSSHLHLHLTPSPLSSSFLPSPSPLLLPHPLACCSWAIC